MRRRQNTLLAGIAALALVAGTGISLAQNQPSQAGSQGTTAGQGASTSPSTAGGGAMQHGSTNAGAAAQANTSAAGKQSPTAQQKIGQNAKQQSSGQAGNRSAQNAEQGKMRHGQKSHMNRAAQNDENRQGATMRSRTERNAALREHGRTRFNTAQEHRRGERNGNLHGLQANTSIPMQGARGGNVNLTGQQRTEIDRVVDASNAPRADRVDFNVRIGTVVPRRSIRVVPVPDTLVQIEPRWRGYEYFVYNNQVVVVSPRTMRIVAVLPA